MRLFIALLIGFAVVSLMFYGIWLPWPDPIEGELNATLARRAQNRAKPREATVERVVEAALQAPVKAWTRSVYAEEFVSVLDAVDRLCQRAGNEGDLGRKRECVAQARALLELLQSRVDDEKVPNDDWVADVGFKHDLSVALARALLSVDQIAAVGN